MKKDQDFRSTYQTGSTNPPKNRHSMIALLLILITVLCSVVTVLGMMNVRLLRLLETEQAQSNAYEEAEQIAQMNVRARDASVYADNSPLGLSCEEIGNLYRSYHHLPQGLYVSRVEPDGRAHRAGLMPGDVLIACNDQAITKEDHFFSYINEQKSGTVIRLTVFRNEQQLTFSLTI